MIAKKTDPSDGADSGFAWTRYRWLMTWMACVSFVATSVALGALWWIGGPVPPLFLLFTAGGIFLAMLLAAALMGLVFVSAASGHDEQVQDITESDDDD
jgi:hypothetical protein